ncbi:MAG: hypothetical protein BIFFINMI_01289 [Phycisphaerae bacterium]|nr:hypothetical protein [Phycisphaerae bacterium]
MSRWTLLAATVLMACLSAVARGDVTFTIGPQAAREGRGVRISFTLSAPADVEVAVINAKGQVVRHLAAGVLGADNDPPAPLAKGLTQSLVWDGKDDAGKAVAADAGPMTVRVRAGMSFKLGRLIASNPYAMGHIGSVAADDQGNVYLYSTSSGTGAFKQIVALDGDGKYLRTLLPFPANLSPDRVKAWARYDDAPRPINQNGLGPEFYTNAELTLLKSADDKGVLLTDGRNLLRIAFDGGMVGDSFSAGPLWAKKPLPNTGGGPTCLAVSPDGKRLYLSGPYSSNTAYGHKADPDFPPGRVYCMEISKGTMQPFADLPTIGTNPAKSGEGWRSNNIPAPGHYTVAHGPIHGICVDKAGNVLVADQDGNRVAVLDAAGKLIGQVDIADPDQVAVHPRTGALYVLTKQIVTYQKYKKRLVKFSGWKDAKQLAELDLGNDKYSWPQMVLAPGQKSTSLWIGGLPGDLVRFEDRGDQFVQAGDLEAERKGALSNCDKMAVDYESDTVYAGNAWSTYRRYNGLTGENLGDVRLDGKGPTDLAVGPGGYIFAQLGPGFSGPLGRWTRDLKPAPFEALGTHILSNYIYGRYHGMGGDCEKGLGVGPDGTLYCSWMFSGWVKYAVSAFAPDGRPLNGKYSPIDEGHYKKGTPAELKQAIIGPIPSANGGVRVDSHGRIYVGLGGQLPGAAPPDPFGKDAAYDKLVGTVVRWGPEGGRWVVTRGKDAQPKPTEQAVELDGGNYFVGADRVYPSLAPLSGGHIDAGSFGNIAFCVCRVPRFDLDRFDRLYVPNAVTNSVLVYDSEANLIGQFGAYGNADSAGVGSAIPAPAIPLGWPTGVGVSESHVYVGDLYNRRVVRVDPTWALSRSVQAE